MNIRERLFYVEHGSTYLKILSVRYRGEDYIKAWVAWYSMPGKTFLREERNLKIPLSAFSLWKSIPE